MYVGKAARLRNRLAHHYRHSNFLYDLAEKCRLSDLSFVPFVAVWYSEERAALEAKLIKELSPLYNNRSE